MKMVELIILVIIGIVAGMLSGLFGIGGGVVIVPALVFFLGMTQHQAQGVSLSMMLPPIGILAVYNYYQGKHLDKTYLIYALIMALAFIIGGYLGSKVSLNVNELTLKRVFGVFILFIAIRMIFFSK